MFSSFQGENPKTVCCTVRSPVLGHFPRCEAGFGRCERLFWDFRRRDKVTQKLPRGGGRPQSVPKATQKWLKSGHFVVKLRIHFGVTFRGWRGSNQKCPLYCWEMRGEIPAVLSRGIPGNALRAFPGSFQNFSGISSGKSQPYWGHGPSYRQTTSQF